MKSIACFFSLFLFLTSYANDLDQTLQVEKEGLVVVVVDFQDGDKIKLFEVESGDHILSKTHGEIDLSQLPMGSYLLENNQGESVVIVRMEEDINIEGAIENVESNFVVEYDSERVDMPSEVNVEEEFVHYYENSETNLLEITREGNFVTVVNFEEGDKIKLFEVKNTVHILSKTTNFVDLSQLPVGVYVLENNRGESVVVEKYVDNDVLVADM
ncbi:uncharacterized protein YkuJ [Aquimarina sp. EL_43]|uniref:hypothetical protein n=1 Tax=Aquimarina TaxID=290174 RepID=UPI000552CE1A|nr:MULTISPECIES: hypothetical protein [Aquimarina]MBG6132437.1 uncharacterized protein YkuJ [Aquimarina sp. EL_35]MBG6152568.1 uncharacterized protein YkuJ [Aquimarina sp. EL_32]MBG6170505.1 uncharacterized protein YkuJ [Aquimarina sp. EL_43]